MDYQHDLEHIRQFRQAHPDDDMWCVKGEYLQELLNEHSELAKALKELCDSVERWEASVEKIIGRQPESGMCTKKARAVLETIGSKE